MISDMSTRSNRNGILHTVPFLSLIGVGFLILGGCPADHRVSMADFLDAQQRNASPMEEAVSSQDILTLDKNLGPYRVGPGDILSVTLTRADQSALFPATLVRVDRNGEIELPIVRGINVDGLLLDEVDDKIRDAFIPGVLTDGSVYTELAAPDETNVLVFGAVSTPGLVPLRRTERNLLFAIVGAGGVSSLASGHATLRRLRRPGAEEAYDLHDTKSLKESLAADPLEEGDVVFVEAADQNSVFIGGLVARGGVQTYPDGTNVTVLQALAAAGGLQTDVHPKEGTLVRRMPDGSDVHVKLDLRRIATGQDQNLMLASGDILWVPETWQTRTLDFINQNFFMRAGVTVNYSVTGTEFLNRAGRIGGQSLQDQADPFGFLTRGSQIQGLSAQPAP